MHTVLKKCRLFQIYNTYMPIERKRLLTSTLIHKCFSVSKNVYSKKIHLMDRKLIGRTIDGF